MVTNYQHTQLGAVYGMLASYEVGGSAYVSTLELQLAVQACRSRNKIARRPDADVGGCTFLRDCTSFLKLRNRLTTTVYAMPAAEKCISLTAGETYDNAAQPEKRG